MTDHPPQNTADLKTRLDYIERDVRDMNDKQTKFAATFEVQMQHMEELIRRKDQENETKFVRSDNLKLILENINKNIEGLTDIIQKNGSKTEGLEKYEEMLKDIKKEREAIKFKVMGYIQQGVFYAVCAGTLLGLLKK